ncbi:MAG: hypothetical protein ABR532_02555 [Candidatus Dormibacteria bacterium]
MIHPKVAAGGIVGLVAVGGALAALLTGNLTGSLATVVGIVLPVGLALVAAYLKTGPATGIRTAALDVVEGMEQGLPPAAP